MRILAKVSRMFSGSAIFILCCMLICFQTDPPENILITSGSPTECPYDENVGITLICSASGYPIPSYTWFDLTNDVVISETNTTTINKDGIYQCNASNTIKTVKYSISTVANVSDCCK